MFCLVTGGAGFIGSHTVDALLERGYRVRILDNLSQPVHLKGKPSYLPREAEFILGDVRTKQDWQKALRGVDVVFHFAAYQDYLTDFSKFFHVNSVGTALLYEIIIGERLPVKKVVLASSQAVYGEGKFQCSECGNCIFPDIRPLAQLEKGQWEHRCPHCKGILEPLSADEEMANPQNQYAISKYSQELIALNLGRRYGIPTVALRYSIVQGPRQSFYNAYSGACRIFALNLYFNKAPIIFEDGNQLRDYVNIQDVVRANLLVMENPKADYQIFNVGGGKAYTVLEFYEIVAKVYGKDIRPEIPGAFRFGDTRHIFSDVSKLKSLGWEPHFSPEKSVSDYVSWLQTQTEIEDVLDYAEKRMKELHVLREVKHGQISDS